MRTQPLTVACPQCGSGEVFYTCSPACCFNHVCSGCGTTFETATRAAGGFLREVLPPDPLPDSTSPAAECALCQAAEVYQTGDGRPVCAHCGALLHLDLTAIAPAG